MTIIFVYNTYKIIEDKCNIALLESLGVGFRQLIKMRILEQIMMLLSMGCCIGVKYNNHIYT